MAKDIEEFFIIQVRDFQAPMEVIRELPGKHDQMFRNPSQFSLVWDRDYFVYGGLCDGFILHCTYNREVEIGEILQIKTRGPGSGATWDKFVEFLESTQGYYLAKITRTDEDPMLLTVQDGVVTESKYE